MKNWIIGILVILLIIVLWPKKKDTELIEKINKLEQKVDLLNIQKDSIRIVIDSTHIKIITNEKHYKETVNTIIARPDTFSESFTRQYLRDFAAINGYYIRSAPEIK